MGVADAGLVGLHLLERLRLHEVPVLAIGVEELHVGIDYVGRFQVVGRLHRQLDHASGLDEPVLDPGEGLTLARLDVFGLGDDARLAVDQYLQTVLHVVHAVGGHAVTPANGM